MCYALLRAFGFSQVEAISRIRAVRPEVRVLSGPKLSGFRGKRLSKLMAWQAKLYGSIERRRKSLATVAPLIFVLDIQLNEEDSCLTRSLGKSLSIPQISKPFDSLARNSGF